MLRFKYSQARNPPAPSVFLTISCSKAGQTRTMVPAQIDTAADFTVLPEKLVNDMGLTAIAEHTIGGLGNTVHIVPVVRVEIGIHDLPRILVAAVALRDEPDVLLGRDVLNHHRLLLDGPGLALEVS